MLLNSIKNILSFLYKKNGQSIVEYTFIIAGIAAVVLLIFGVLTGSIDATFQQVINFL